MAAMRSLRFAIYLRGTPEQVRAVLSDPALTPRWLAGTQFHTDAAEDPQRLSCEWLQTDRWSSGTQSEACAERKKGSYRARHSNVVTLSPVI